MRDFLKDNGIAIPIFSGNKSSSRGTADILVTEVTSEVWRRDEQLYDLRPELSLQILRGTLFLQKT